ncbi:MAG: hypothetical protein ACFFBD_10780 [Candidatus Hodarchaeota archaeon]
MSYWYGYGFGRGGGRGYGLGRGGGFGGRGNPSPYCRWYPNMPRGWWRMPTSYWKQLGVTPTPVSGISPVLDPLIGWNYTMSHASDKEILKAQVETLEAQLEALRQRLTELEK